MEEKGVWKGAPASDQEALELFQSVDKTADHVLSLAEFEGLARTADCPLDKVRGFVLDIGEDGSLTEADFIGFFRKMRSSAQKSRYEAAASRAYTPAPVDGTWLLVEELSSPGTPRGKARFKPSVLLSPSSPSASSRTPLAPKAASSLEESGGVRPAVHTNSLAWSFLARGVARKVAQKIVTDSLLTFMCFPIRRAQMIVQTCDAFSGLGECLHALTRDCTGLFRGYLSGVASSFVWEVTGVITNCIMRVLVPTYDRESDMALWAVTNVWKRSFPPLVQILASYPLTMAEVRLALDFGPGPREFGGILDCIRGVNQSEGVVGIYKGVGAMMMGMCCQQTISLVIRKTLIRLFKPGRPFKPWERIALDEPAQIVAGALTTPFFFLHFKYINGNVQGKKLLEEAWYRGAFTSGIIVEVSNRAVWTATPMVMRRISGAVQDYFNELPVEMYRPIGDPGFDRFIQSAASRTPHDAKRTRAHLFIDFSKSERPPLTPKHHSLMAKYLSDRTWLKYRDVKTATGFSFSNLIQCGVMQRASAIGIVLGDEHSSEVFKDLVHPIVKAWHKIDPHYQKQTQGDLDASKLVLTDIQRLRFQAKVVSCRICCSRNLSGYPFPPAASSIDMVTIEELFKRAFQGLATDLPKEMKRPAVTPSKTHYLSLSGATRHWPEGRSIISNDAYKATINHSDHLLLETKEEGGDMATCFRRFCFVLGHLRAAVRADGRDWAFCDRLGYLTSNIADLGTRAILTISVPLFSKEGHVQLEAIAAQHDLQASFRNRAWDLSNRTRIGLNEVDMLQRLVDGVHTILSVETMLEEGHSLDEALARA